METTVSPSPSGDKLEVTREEESPTAERDTLSPSSIREGDSLSDEITKLFKERTVSPSPAPSDGNLGDEIAATLKKRRTPSIESSSELTKDEEISGSVDDLQNEIMSMLTSFGNSKEEEAGTEKEKHDTPTTQRMDSPSLGQYLLLVIMTSFVLFV